MKKFLLTIFSTSLIIPIYVFADDSFSVEIEALTLVMENYNNNNLTKEDPNNQNFSYMAFKKDECNARVEVTEKNGLQDTTMQSFHVNVCEKEINKNMNH